MPKYRNNNPAAGVLMVSMRAMGYSFETAIADIIDNSISAGATKVNIKFPVDPMDCYVAICDNGRGMSPEELFNAMRYGSQPDGALRADNDLGRFGLGMKSASLSQCRKLTVISKKNGVVSSLSWDLDLIENEKNNSSKTDWLIIEYSPREIKNIRLTSYLDDYEHGTVVIWEKFDLIEKSTGSVYQELSKYKETLANFLSLIFHRFLNKERTNNIEMYINDFKLSGLDPFLEKHKKTNPRREIKIPITDSHGVERYVKVHPYVLPFQKDLSRQDLKTLGGVEDYRTKQGYYIYRNERLIIWGTWFGRAKNELTKHARVKVDIPNTLDDIWGIDIKKQNATIPKIIKHQLTKAVDEAMDIAVKAQTYRGRIENTDENIDYIWDRIEERDNQFIYKINRQSKIFDLIKGSIDDSTWSKIEMVLEEVENGIPYQQIYIDKSQNKVIDEINSDRTADIESKAQILISMAMNLGQNDRSAVIKQLFCSEPFNKYQSIKDKLLEEEKYHDC